MPPSKINPAKATPQAARALRAGTKARAAEGDPATDPAEGDAGGEGEASESDLAAAAKSCRDASSACADAITALDKCADELEAGTDSISTLKATEDACAAADTALDDASSKCAGLRGASPAADSEPPPAPAPGAAARAATVPTVAGHIEVARLAAFGRSVMSLVGQTDTAKALASLTPRLKLAEAALSGLAETDPVRARGVLGARLARALQADELDGQLAATGAAADTARREKLWEGAVVDGRLKLVQAFARQDDPAGGVKPIRVYSKWATAQNAAYPELAAFEGWIGSLPKGAHKAENADPNTVLADLAEARAGAVTLSKRDMQRAKAAGVDPALLTAALQQQRGTVSNQEGV